MKVIEEVSSKKYQRTNIIAGYTNKKTIAECVYKNNTDTEFLVPELKPGQVVVMDNASFHKNKRTRELRDSGDGLRGRLGVLCITLLPWMKY
jgi:transposase